MAVTDLTNELKKDTFNVSEQVERSIVAQLLRALEDKSSEVQNLVVKRYKLSLFLLASHSDFHSLPVAVARLRFQQVEEIIDKLVRLMSSDREDLRDLAGIGTVNCNYHSFC